MAKRLLRLRQYCTLMGVLSPQQRDVRCRHLVSRMAASSIFLRVRSRKMSRRRLEAARKKKRQQFMPDVHGLERRMMPATFLVNTTADSGAGSLRQAILDSDGAGPGPNTIDFGIGSGGAQTIFLMSALPDITVPVLIDGTSQTNYSGTPLIDIDGTSAGPSADGLVLSTGSDGSTIERFSHQ